MGNFRGSVINSYGDLDRAVQAYATWDEVQACLPVGKREKLDVIKDNYEHLVWERHRKEMRSKTPLWRLLYG